MSLLAGDLLAAEGILLQNGFVSEAIKINIQMYNWNRALELAIRHKKLLDEVLDSRRIYLKLLDKNETNPSYIALTINKTKSEINIVNESNDLEFNDNKMEDIIFDNIKITEE
ncbi:hypothetical protein PV325_011812 [Microctonus aethiopoides]|nr:hypothetical protein PV325_011812 [Microctonus aethiopoides]